MPEAGQTKPPLVLEKPVSVNVAANPAYTVVWSVPSTDTLCIFQSPEVSALVASSLAVGLSDPHAMIKSKPNIITADYR